MSSRSQKKKKEKRKRRKMVILSNTRANLVSMKTGPRRLIEYTISSACHFLSSFTSLLLLWIRITHSIYRHVMLSCKVDDEEEIPNYRQLLRCKKRLIGIIMLGKYSGDYCKSHGVLVSTVSCKAAEQGQYTCCKPPGLPGWYTEICIH